MLENRKVEVGKTYKHFKGTLHKVILIAKDSESLEDMVVYTHEEDESIWIRPEKMFLSKVDKTKYPEVEQEYRFELLK